MRLLIIILISFTAKAAVGQIRDDTAFWKSKGKWILPIDTLNYLRSERPTSNISIECSSNGLSIQVDTCAIVHFLQPGKVVLVDRIGSSRVVIIRRGSFFFAYSGFDTISVKKGDNVTDGQNIGSLAETDNGNFQLDLILYYRDRVINHLENWFDSTVQKMTSHPIR